MDATLRHRTETIFYIRITQKTSFWVPPNPILFYYVAASCQSIRRTMRYHRRRSINDWEIPEIDKIAAFFVVWSIVLYFPSLLFCLWYFVLDLGIVVGRKFVSWCPRAKIDVGFLRDLKIFSCERRIIFTGFSRANKSSELEFFLDSFEAFFLFHVSQMALWLFLSGAIWNQGSHS